MLLEIQGKASKKFSGYIRLWFWALYALKRDEMNWQVEILRIYGEEEILRAVLEGSGYDLILDVSRESKSWLLEHVKYDSFDTADLVYEDAKIG